MKYYPSLDGVRAVAVGIVLLAHAGVPHVLSGGAGVDIFFALRRFFDNGNPTVGNWIAITPFVCCNSMRGDSSDCCLACG